MIDNGAWMILVTETAMVLDKQRLEQLKKSNNRTETGGFDMNI